MARRARTFVRAYNSEAIARVRARLEGYSEEQLQRAADRAGVGVVRKAQPVARRDIRERYGVKSSQLTGAIKGTHARDSKGHAYVGVWASSRQISLLHFGGRWRKKSAGATAAVKPGQRKTYDSAFITTIEGRTAIRVRAHTAGPGSKRHGRGPLRMLRGPSPFEMLLGQHMANGDKIAGKLLEFYSTEIARQIDLIRSRR